MKPTSIDSHDSDSLKAQVASLNARIEALLAQNAEPTDAEGRHLRDAIDVGARDKLLVFLARRDVAPTNNESERALRPSVILRKVTNCLRSTWGAKVYADLCSIVGTGRINGHCALHAIRATLTPA